MSKKIRRSMSKRLKSEMENCDKCIKRFSFASWCDKHKGEARPPSQSYCTNCEIRATINVMCPTHERAYSLENNM